MKAFLDMIRERIEIVANDYHTHPEANKYILGLAIDDINSYLERHEEAEICIPSFWVEEERK